MELYDMPLLTRRRFNLLATGFAAGVLLPIHGAHAHAARPIETRQTPGVLRWHIGDIEVTAISDGFIEVPLTVVPKANPDEVERLQRAGFLKMPPGALDIAVNTYLIRDGDRLTLIDTGCGQRYGATAGKLLDNLAAVGAMPDAIDTLLLTHLHSDQVFGLTAPDGTAVFPNAEFVVHANELAFWQDDGNLSRASDYFKRFFSNAREAVAPYARQIRKFAGECEELIPGVAAVLLPGHTPGMTGYRIGSSQDQLFIWADIVHVPHLQFAHPEWGMKFDTDMDQAAETRRRTFDWVATDRNLVTGMHLGFPGFGHVIRTGPAYSFVPAPWRFTP
jgi:glyoxylase-like metal-dependent hydrolase (beta-lactamase superfamily II)